MASAVPPEEIPTGHTTSDQWQSFEMRMRQRRIDRLLVRADAALGAGDVGEARSTVDELERLSPHATGLEQLRHRLAQAADSPQAVPPPIAKPQVVTPPVVQAPVVTPLAVTPPVVETPVVAPPPVAPPVVVARPAVEKPLVKPSVVKPAIVKPAVVKPPVVTPPVVKPAIVTPAVVNAPRKPDAVARPAAPFVDVTDAPAASAPLRVDVQPVERSGAQAPEAIDKRRSRLPQVAAAILIVGSLAWLAVPYAPRPGGGARASGPPSSPPVASPPPEPVSPAAAPPAVDVAVTEIAPAEAPPAAPPPEETGTPEPAAPAALVGQTKTIPATQPTTAAGPVAITTAPPAAVSNLQPEEPAPVGSAAAVPEVTLAATPALERAPEPPPEPPPAAPAAAPPAATAAPSAAPAPAAVPDEARILTTLGRYEAAYSNLDVNAAGAVWPGVDKRALGRAFDGLSSQRVDLGNCDVRVVGETAVAECSGTAAWTPKIGGGSHRQARRWQFRLRSEGGGWQIVSANVR